MTVDVTVRRGKSLVTTESYQLVLAGDAGGRSEPVVRVNGDFLGCVVEPGEAAGRASSSAREQPLVRRRSLPPVA